MRRLLFAALILASGCAQTLCPAAETGPRLVVVRVPPNLVQRAKDEAALANLLNSDVEDSAVGRGMVDYRKRVAIVRMMEKVRKEYADEANQMN